MNPTRMRAIAKFNPSTGELIAEYPAAGPQEVAAAVSGAREALAYWRKLPLKARARVLEKLAGQICRRTDELADAICREVGKPRADAIESDIGTALNVLHYYAARGPRCLKARRLPADFFSLVSGRIHWETYHPRGVIAVISPWNYPVANPASGIGAALMAGNAVILKPSELSPESGRLLVAIVQDVLKSFDLPPNLVQCLLGNGETGSLLLGEHIDGVIFTGSERTGRKIREAIADRHIWSSLELGGSDAMIVLEGCNLEAAASYAVWGRFSNAGQVCAAVKRLLVPASARAEMLRHLKTKVERLRVGPPEDPASQVGPLISEAQLNLMTEQVQDAVARGATLVTGGRRTEGSGWFYEPTLLTDVPADARILNEEVFGPALPVQTYETVEEAVALANASAYGLTSSLFGPADTAMPLANRLESGTVVVNDVGASNYAMACAPWGGWKSSGLGASHGERALQDLSRIQVVSQNRLFDWPLFNKPLWHFNAQAGDDEERARTVAALAGRQLPLWHPRALLAFWKNRAARKL